MVNQRLSKFKHNLTNLLTGAIDVPLDRFQLFLDDLSRVYWHDSHCDDCITTDWLDKQMALLPQVIVGRDDHLGRYFLNNKSKRIDRSSLNFTKTEKKTFLELVNHVKENGQYSIPNYSPREYFKLAG